MKRFNLLDSPWISVMTSHNGETKEVSINELFSNAHNYVRLAGETPSQDFAVLRFLLSIMHTAFSRFDVNGETYLNEADENGYINPDELEDEELQEKYQDLQIENWIKLWKGEKLPDAIQDYLLRWNDRFYLFSDKNPFYQVSELELNSLGIPISETTEIGVKYINRLISESNNKLELFSPADWENKESWDEASLARWIITYQGYTGTSEKKKYPGMTESVSRGWLLGLGSVYLEGRNLKETLLLNMSLLFDGQTNLEYIQKPIWELELVDKIKTLISPNPMNLAELYTNWSRLLVVSVDQTNDKKALKVRNVSMPGISQVEFFLEPMTLWICPKSGTYKDTYIPKTHVEDIAFWRSFGLAILPSSKESNHRRPKIIDWVNYLVENELIEERYVRIVSVGLSYNRDASSMLNGEIYDSLNIHEKILNDDIDDGWIYRISSEVDLTKRVIDYTLSTFGRDIQSIRNIQNNFFVRSIVEEAYFEIDKPFRTWLEEIKPTDNKNDKIIEWRQSLEKIIKKESLKLIEKASSRDFLGIEKDNKIINISTVYNKFLSNLAKQLREGR